MIEICIWESKAPLTLKWAENVKNRGGYTASHVPAIINYLQRDFDFRLRDFAPALSFMLFGAWLEDCMGKLPIMLIEDYGAQSISINMKKVYSTRERVEPGWNTEAFDASARAVLLHSSHPKLRDYKDKITLIVN